MARQVTITLDDDVAARLENQARRSGTSLDELVKETLRHAAPDTGGDERQPFRVQGRLLHLREGVSLDCVWKLLDEEDAEQWAK